MLPDAPYPTTISLGLLSRLVHMYNRNQNFMKYLPCVQDFYYFSFYYVLKKKKKTPRKSTHK